MLPERFLSRVDSRQTSLVLRERSVSASTNFAGLVLVHPRMGARRLEHLRQHAISKATAVWSIVLILLPVTAPFPSYRLQHSSDGLPINALPKDLQDKIGSDDELAVPPRWSLVQATLIVAVADCTPPVKQTTRHSAECTVLRL
jgi:hypothetical protein